MQLIVILPLTLQRCLTVSYPNTIKAYKCEHLYSVMEAKPLWARCFKWLQNNGGVLSFQEYRALILAIERRPFYLFKVQPVADVSAGLISASSCRPA